MNDYGYYMPEYSARKRTPLEDIRRIHGNNRPEFKYHVVSLDAPRTVLAGFQIIGDAIEYVRNSGKSDKVIKVV